jgi:hypothetical protein
LDLSRNVEKLSGEVKKNTTVNKDLVKSDSTEPKTADQSKDLSKIAEGLKSMDLKGLKDEFKGLKDGLKGIDKLDFRGLENGLKSLDFKGLEKGLKGLDFKGLEQGLKGLDFKGLEQGLKGFDIKGITESFRGITNIKNLDVGGMAKNIVSGGGVKDLISGSIGKIGKGILGRFEEGGEVKKSGPYLVGEKGPEIANLSKDTTVVPNDKTEAILSGKPAAVKTRIRPGKYPSAEQIEAKKKEIIASGSLYDPNDPAELAEEIEDYKEHFRMKSLQSPNSDIKETFTMGDVAKLGKSTNKDVNSESTSGIKSQMDVLSKGSPDASSAKKKSRREKKAELEEKKPGLFSKLFSKENIKSVDDKIGGAASGLLGGELKDKLTGTLKGSAESLINKESLGIPDFAKSTLTSGLSFLNKGSKEKSPTLFGDMKKNLPTLSSMPGIKSKVEAAASKVVNNIESKSPINDILGNNTPPGMANTETVKTEGESSAAGPKPGGEGGTITKKDIDTIISLLSRMGSLLEGPLSVASMDSPIRPDSRRV